MLCLFDLLVSPASQPAKGACFPYTGPKIRVLNGSSKHSHLGEDFCPCNLLFPLSSLLGSQILTWSPLFPSYSIPHIAFLQSWLYRGLSATLLLVFSETCSTYTWILTYSWGGMFCILQFHFLYSSLVPPLLYHSSLIWKFLLHVCAQIRGI